MDLCCAMFTRRIARLSRDSENENTVNSRYSGIGCNGIFVVAEYLASFPTILAQITENLVIRNSVTIL